ALPPLVRISSTTWLAGSCSVPSPERLVPRSLTTTFAPAFASAMAMPRPMPRPDPVTSADLPSSRPMHSVLYKQAIDGPQAVRQDYQRIDIDLLRVRIQAQVAEA